MAVGGEARIKEVVSLADESCRNWIRAWGAGNTFLKTQAMMSRHSDGTPSQGHRFYIGEIRPATENYALVFVDHKQQSIHRQLGGSDWNDVPLYMVYNLTDNSCRETEYSAKAWAAWPEILPELKEQASEAIQETTPEDGDISTPAVGSESTFYGITGPSTVRSGTMYEYVFSGPANTDVYVA